MKWEMLLTLLKVGAVAWLLFLVFVGLRLARVL
jgi:hypothetical protein